MPPTPGWEDLETTNDEEYQMFPPPPPSGDFIVDRTPLLGSQHKQALFNEKTPLVSHKSSSGLNELASKVTSQYNTVVEDEYEYIESSLSNHVEEDERSLSSINSVLSWSTASSLVTLSTAYLGNFKSSLLLPFTDETGSPSKIAAGLASLFFVGITVGVIMPKDEHLVGRWYPYISSMLGYTYFLSWSVCFYPQVMMNYKRKSTAGLSHDFAILNFMGWACYAAYECAMFFDQGVIDLYRRRFKSADNTVQSNDVAFALHALALAVTYLIQIVYYGDSWWSIKIKRQTWIIICCIVMPSVIVPILIQTKVFRFDFWLDYFYMLSFLKISCTLTKYIKQVLFNIQRRSTKGWNIWYNFLEFVGGILSMTQVVLDSANMGDWTGVTGNMAKFALGFLTIFFDIIFFLQHYVIYPHEPDNNMKKDIKNIDIDITRAPSSLGDLSTVGNTSD